MLRYRKKPVEILRPLTVLLFLFLACCGASAQEPVFTRGEYLPLNSQEKPLTLLPSDENQFFFIKTGSAKKNSILIERISRLTLGSAGKLEFSLPEVDGNSPEFEDVLAFDNGVVIIFNVYEKRSRTYKSYAQKINKDLQVEGNFLKIAEAHVQNKRNTGTSRFISGPDGSLLVLNLSLDQEPETTEFSLNLYDKNLRHSWEKEIKVPYPSSSFDLGKIILDPLGGVHILASVSAQNELPNNRNRRFGKQHFLIEYIHNQNTVRELELSLGQKWIYDAELIMADSNTFNISGFYSNIADLIIAGVFTLTFDAREGKILSQGLQPFSRDFIASFRNQKTGMDMDPELNLYYHKIADFPGENGTLLTAEKRYVHTTTIYNPHTGLQTLSYDYNFEYILACHVEPNGIISWENRIIKFQSSGNPTCSRCSYSAFPMGSGSLILYNDHQKNAGLANENPNNYKTLYVNSENLPVYLMINESGEISKNPLTDPEEKFWIIPSVYLQTSSDQVIIYGESGNACRFIQIDWKE